MGFFKKKVEKSVDTDGIFEIIDIADPNNPKCNMQEIHLENLIKSKKG
jgi:hypothetical protein